MTARSLPQRLARALRTRLRHLDPWRWRSQLLLEQAGRAPLAGHSVAVFNHFDAQGRVAGYVLHHLQALAAEGFRLVFVTTAPRLEPEALEALRPWVWLVLQRRNFGMDLGGWPVAWAAVQRRSRLPPQAFKRWLFTNDSVFGPLQPLAPLLAQMPARGHAVWGISSSRERLEHLQSYFVVFEQPALAFLAQWVQGPRLLEDREAMIQRFELPLLQRARAAGLQVGAWVDPERLQPLIDGLPESRHPPALNDAQGRFAGNPTHWYWRECVAALGCPYIKRDLLQARRGLTAQDWEAVLQQHAPDYPVALVRDYLAS